MEPPPRSTTPDSADNVGSVGGHSANSSTVLSNITKKKAKPYFEHRPDGQWACNVNLADGRVCGKLLTTWHNSSAVRHIEGAHKIKLPVTPMEPELTKGEKEKLEEARRLLRENCRLRQEVFFLEGKECKECWCYGEPIGVDRTFCHIEPDDDTILEDMFKALPAKR